jgi:nicotinamide riboside kinase
MHARFRAALAAHRARVVEIRGSWEERKARAVDAVVAALEEARCR